MHREVLERVRPAHERDIEVADRGGGLQRLAYPRRRGRALASSDDDIDDQQRPPTP